MCEDDIWFEGNIHEIPRYEMQKLRKIFAKENNHTWQYLHGLVTCLCLRSCRDFIILREKKKKIQGA